MVLLSSTFDAFVLLFTITASDHYRRSGKRDNRKKIVDDQFSLEPRETERGHKKRAKGIEKNQIVFTSILHYYFRLYDSLVDCLAVAPSLGSTRGATK